MIETIVVTENINKVIVSSPGPQGSTGLNKLNVYSSNPQSATAGDLYYNSSDTRVYVYTGSLWKAIAWLN